MYSWVSSGSVHKYNRAVAQLVKDKKEVTEEAVKELYVKMAGLVVEKLEVEEVEEAPVRRGRRSAE